MAIVDVIGPAHGTLNACGPFAINPSAGMTVSSSSPRPASGGYLMHIDITAGQGNFVKQFASAPNKVVVVCAFRPKNEAAINGAHKHDLLRLYDAGDTKVVELRLDGRNNSQAASQVLSLYAASGATTSEQNHATLPVNSSWYVVEITVDTSANPWALTWRLKPLGGAWVAGPAVGIAAAAATFDYYRVGSNSFDDWIIDVQDLVIATGATTALDDHVVNWFPPDTPGAHNLEASPSANFFGHNGSSASGVVSTDAVTDGYIDDVPIGGSSDRVYATGTPANTRYLEYDFANDARVPSAVKVVEAVQQDSSPGGSVYTSKITDDAGASLTTISNAVDPNSTAEVFKNAVAATKPSGGAWTPDAFQALRYRWGFTADATPVVRLNAVGLEVAFQTQTPVVTATFVLPWESQAAPQRTLGEIPSTGSIVRVWPGTRAPTAVDDVTTGVAAGDTWHFDGNVWWCTSAAAGAAVWRQVTS